MVLTAKSFSRERPPCPCLKLFLNGLRTETFEKQTNKIFGEFFRRPSAPPGKLLKTVKP